MPITQPPPPISRLGLLKDFARVYLSLCLILAVVGGMHYYTVYTTERSTREASESLNVDLARRMIIADISSVTRDLMFLSEHIESQGLLDDLTYRDEKLISEEFTVFAKQKGLYDQIRYLDSSGMEIVRVNYNGGKPKVVQQRNLQNKANRYYFLEAMSQPRGGIYLSPMDLNIEEEKIEYPLKPMIRFGTPVFDSAGHQKGVILLNYFGERLIENFKRATANIASHVELVNAAGYWLSNPESRDEWGFMFGDKTVFSHRFPAAWWQIEDTENGQFQTKEGLFTFTTIYPVTAALQAANPAMPEVSSAQHVDKRFWKIIARISSKELSATLPFFIQNHLSLYAAMFGLLALVAWFLSHSQHRHRLAEAQRDYEQRFRHTLENIDLAAIALDRQGTVTFCNDHFMEITGWNRREVIGKSWLQRFVSDDRHSEVANIIEGMRYPEQFPSKYENQVKTRNGSLRLIAWNNTLSYDAEGQVIGVTGIGEDITEQRQAEEELHKLYRAVEQSPSIVLITNRNGLIDYVNPKFIQVSGYSHDEVIGRNPRFLKSGETSQEEYSKLWHSIAQGGEWRGEFHNRKKSGELYWESATISAIRNPEGKITHFLAVKEDITERKRLEKEVEERNRELAKSQALAAMGRMASMIAHDLRNPLSSVKMTLQILGKQTTKEHRNEVDELRVISLEQIRYMEEILSDMLTFSRPDALKPEWMSIEREIDLAVNLSTRRIDESDILLETHYHPGLPTLYGDPTKLRQVFGNLISNAAQATEGVHKPRVTIDVMVELGQNGTGIRTEICDNGYGIEPDQIERLFEPFFTTRAKGTGLGLAIVKRILDQHHATIELLPNKPQGTCVVVVLPVVPALEQDAAEPEETDS